MGERGSSRGVCPWCGGERVGTPEALAETPWCADCLHDRVAAATRGKGPVVVRAAGDGYVVIERADAPADEADQ